MSLALSCIHEGDTIVDVGVSSSTNGDTNYFEKWFNSSNSVTCLGVDKDYSRFQEAFPHCKVIQFDGFHFPEFGRKFDFAFSNAVIEHVGNREKQVYWLGEVRKLANLFLITTPNRWLPFETHSMTFFFHWFPDRVRNFFYRRIGKGIFADDYMWLLGERDFRAILREAGFEIVSFRKNRFFGFTMDFVAICTPGPSENAGVPRSTAVPDSCKLTPR
jgi:SAM-dependent methyltransferase